MEKPRWRGAAFAALAKWYASHSAVRRLWAIEESQLIRVVVTLEPTQDGDDTYPVWLANSREWAHELQLRMDRIVQLAKLDEPSFEEFAIDSHGILVAELSWRDPGVPAD